MSAVTSDEIAAAYFDLLCLPAASVDRHYAQKALCVLRDLIAERTGEDAETVQTTFELKAQEIHKPTA